MFSGKDHYHTSLTSTSVSKDWKLWQIDVKNVFLHKVGREDLHEQIEII